MTWELKHVEDVECTLDESGVYVVINRVKRGSFDHRHDDFPMFVEVRADLMRSNSNEPIVSFQGSANAVRKHLIRFIPGYLVNQHLGRTFSLEHASYIGYELLRAETNPDYVQD